MPQAPSSLEHRIAAVGDRLGDSLRCVLGDLGDAAQRPNQLSRLLGVNRDISGRVLNATRADHPLAVTHVIPGPEPLRKLLRAARRKGVAAEVIDDAEAAVSGFETLIREVAGDRPALDAIISSLLPPARERFELAAKQTIFKGTSLLRGVAADTWLHAALVHPSADDVGHHDVAYIYGTLGLRRVRPGIPVKFTYRQFGTRTHPMQPLDGDELDAYCDRPVAPLETVADEAGEVFALAGDEVGPASASDKLLAEVRPSAMGRVAADRPRNLKSLFVAPSVPVKLLVFDVLLHADAYPGAEPVLYMYDTTVEGMASVNDPARDADRLDVQERVSVLGRDVAALTLTEMPRYGEMLGHVTERLVWDLSAFRGYRCRIQYPMYGAQACLAFDAGRL